MICNQCPRRCNADRDKTVGFCGVGSKLMVARAAPHYWEEPCISGQNGSGTVFFSGCSLRCVFCQNYELSHCSYGVEITEYNLMKLFDRLIEQGVHNLNLVTPSHYTDTLAKVLAEYDSTVPVVWNSSGYESVEALKKLEGLVDIYLPDVKYYDSAVSSKYSGASDYFEVAVNAVTEMYRQVGGLVIDSDGIAIKGTIVRHLVLPGNVSQSVKIINTLEDVLGSDIGFSLMRQYIPFGEAKNISPLNRKTTAREYSIAKSALLSSKFENCFFQSLTAASEDYIPDFDIKALDLDNT